MRNSGASITADKFAYDYTYIVPLALIKTVPGLGFTLGWAFSVLLVGLRLLVNLIAIKVNKDLKPLDNRISQIARAIESKNYLEAVGLFLAVIAEIVDAAVEANVLKEQALAVLDDLAKENLGQARRDLITSFETLSGLLTSGLRRGPPPASMTTKICSRRCPCRLLRTLFSPTRSSPICVWRAQTRSSSPR
jgi:hypothetical protein